MADKAEAPAAGRSWLTPTVLGIVLATFFSDFAHEACTAVLPLYLAAVSLGPAALGLVEGVADFLVSLSKLGGGVVGHRLRHKRPWAVLGYLLTAVCTAAIGLVSGLAAILSLRTAAWVARGFRGPLRDALLADEVQRTHYGRAYGLERAGDMLGAVAGPLAAALLVWFAVPFGQVILWSLAPGLVAAACMAFLTRERVAAPPPDARAPARPAFPRAFWVFLVGVTLFGLGDFSRTFLILLAARALGEEGGHGMGTLSVPVLLFALHNLVSAVAAYAIGHWADRVSKRRLLTAGYALGVVTNLLLALLSGSLTWLVVAVVLSGIYLAAEETLEKATAAELLPRELRSLGFGVLASANAVGDMASSLYVGLLLQAGQPGLGFGLAAAVSGAGVAWLSLTGRPRPPASGQGARRADRDRA
jgi:MFS family permease